MWNCCVARNELHSATVAGTNDVSPSKEYGQSQMKNRRANRVFTQCREKRSTYYPVYTSKMHEDGGSTFLQIVGTQTTIA